MGQTSESKSHPPAGHRTSASTPSKEIAAYLNRDVTTVQRWEKREAMPVHRHLHAKRGLLFFFP